MTQSKLPSFLLTMWLLGTIATKSRMSDFLQSLQEYEIVYPRIIPNGKLRNRRSTADHEEEPVFLEINNWTLRTISSDRLILSSNFTVDWIHSNKMDPTSHAVRANCNLRRGNLEGDKSSFAVVTLCEQDVYALIMIDRKSFFVQPLDDGQHVMYRSEHSGWWSSKEDPNIVSLRRGGDTCIRLV